MSTHRTSTLGLRLLARPRASDTLELESLEVGPSSGSPQEDTASLFSLLDSKPTSSVSRKYRDTGSPASYESTSSTDSTLQTNDLVEPDEECSRFSESLMRLFGRRGGKGRALELDVDACATRRSVFDDDVLAKHYWPKEDYEGFERFDVSARWSVREEKALVRKIDWHVMLWAGVMFASLNMDRSNLIQANTDNFLGDLGLTTDDYNLANSLFRIAFLLSELPSQMVAKLIGPDRYVPIQICLWSLVTCFQFFLSGRQSFIWCRILIGFIQGGFIPEMVIYLSYWYTKTELPIRLSFFWMSSNIATISTSFLAFGVLNMRGFMGQEGWRWLFLVEGLLTFTVGVATFFMMPPGPVQTKAWFRPEGWFTHREEVICVTRILRDDPTKGDMHNREGLTLKRLWKACLDYDLWPLYIIGFAFGIPVGPPTSYLTLSLRNLGFDTFTSNLLTIPSVTIGLVTAITIVTISEKVNDRSIVAMAMDLWVLPFLVALYWLPEGVNPWMTYLLMTGMLSYPYVHPIQVAWCSRNSGAVASRTVNASLYNMMVQLSAVFSSYIYRADDAPQYHRGNYTLIVICCLNLFVLYPGTKLYYTWRNQRKAKVWDRMTPEERSAYLQMTEDVGNRRLDFRFAH